MKPLSMRQYAKKRGVSYQRIGELLLMNRIKGATRFGSVWMIPVSAVIKPTKFKPRKRKRTFQCLSCNRIFTFFFNTKHIPDKLKYYLCKCEEQKFKEVK